METNIEQIVEKLRSLYEQSFNRDLMASDLHAQCFNVPESERTARAEQARILFDERMQRVLPAVREELRRRGLMHTLGLVDG